MRNRRRTEKEIRETKIAALKLALANLEEERKETQAELDKLRGIKPTKTLSKKEAVSVLYNGLKVIRDGALLAKRGQMTATTKESNLETVKIIVRLCAAPNGPISIDEAFNALSNELPTCGVSYDDLVTTKLEAYLMDVVPELLKTFFKGLSKATASVALATSTTPFSEADENIECLKKEIKARKKKG